MRRRLFAVVSAVCLLLCLAMLTLWVCFYRRFEQFGPNPHLPHTAFQFSGNFITIFRWWADNSKGHDWVEVNRIDFAGLRVDESLMSDVPGQPCGTRIVVVPYWWIVPPLAVLPIISGFRFIRSFHIAAVGLCAACGYHLTGNTSGVCPECGTRVEGKAAVKT